MNLLSAVNITCFVLTISSNDSMSFVDIEDIVVRPIFSGALMLTVAEYSKLGEIERQKCVSFYGFSSLFSSEKS